MDNAAFQDYLKLLRDIAKTLGKLTELEQRKVKAVHANDVQAVDDCIREEQVMSLSLRGTELKRTKMLKALGMENEPLSKLIEHAPEGLRIETQEAMHSLRNRYNEYQSASTAARTALERVLHDIERMLAAAEQQQGGAPPQPSTGGVRPDPRQDGGEPPVGGHGADFKA